MFSRLRRYEDEVGTISVAVVGAGFIGRGLVHQLGLTPGMRCSIVVARRPEQVLKTFRIAGLEGVDPVITDSPGAAREAISRGRLVMSTTPRILTEVPNLDVVVEATGDVTYGAHVAVLALASGKHVVSLNYETDATVGPMLKQIADLNGVVYTGSDGDQPGVMMRLFDYVRGIGLDVVAAVNCKGFLDRHATPETIRPWSEKQGTSLPMTTAFTDGTKMNVENASLANATGLVPVRRGMLGIETTLDEAADDFQAALDREGVVDYTLGGDFGSGVFVIASGADPRLAAPYLQYLKMGDGPWYLFFRPWHLVHFETPLSIAEAVLDQQPTIAPNGAPQAVVVAVAKRNLPKGNKLDGIGGFDCYGEIDTAELGREFLPVGLADQGRTIEDLTIDEPIHLGQVELDEDAPIVRLWSLQADIFDGTSIIDQTKVIELLSAGT